MTSLVHDPAWSGEVEIPSGPVDEFAGGGAWPRQIVLDEDTSARLKLWLNAELDDHYAERAPIVEKWKDWQKLYWAEPKEKVKNFPFERAANFVVALAAIAAEATHSRLINTLFSVKPFWSIRPRHSDWKFSAKPFEQYLQAEADSEEGLNLYKVANEVLDDLVKLGVGVVKSGYHREFKKSIRTYPDGTDEPFYVETKNSATLEHVPLQNWLFRLNQTDPQTSPWVGEEHTLSWVQIKKFVQGGRFLPETVEGIKNYWSNTQNVNHSGMGASGKEVTNEIRKLADAEPLWNEEFDFVEIWATFDVDGDGEDEEIVIDYHRPSQTFLSLRYNWYDDLRRPYRYGNFIGVVGVWTGIGVCKQTESDQEEVTTIRRQRVDNATLANMTQVAIKKNSGYGPGEPIFPGKQWFLDSPRDDIVPFKLAEIYPSSYMNEEAVMRMFEKRTGANEMILGIQHQGTPGTATGDLARLAEGNKRFDHVLKNVRRFFVEVGKDVVSNYQQFGNQQVHWAMLGDKGELVEKVLQMPMTLVRKGAIIDLTVSDSITNKEIDQRKWLNIFQVLSNYYATVVQYAQLLQDPGVFMHMGQRAIMASDEALRRLLSSHDISDAEQFTLLQETGLDETGIPAEELGPGEGGGPEGSDGLEGEDGVDNIPPDRTEAPSRTGGLSENLARSVSFS